MFTVTNCLIFAGFGGKAVSRACNTLCKLMNDSFYVVISFKNLVVTYDRLVAHLKKMYNQRDIE